MSPLEYGQSELTTNILKMDHVVVCDRGIPMMNISVSSRRSFAGDVEFLRRHVETIVLRDGLSAVAIVPAWQGRIMTSTTNADDGPGFGWINDEFIASGRVDPQANLQGGEDRFWLAPEGSRFSLFFVPGSEMNFDRWRCPALVDTETYRIYDQSAKHVTVSHAGSLTNYSGSRFDVSIERVLSILSQSAASSILGSPAIRDLHMVAHESRNRITNAGSGPWTAEHGLPAIWILGMFQPSPVATVLLPFRCDDGCESEPVINDRYFAKPDASRLRMDRETGVVYFRADGRFRSKIGLRREHVTCLAGSWDRDANAHDHPFQSAGRRHLAIHEQSLGHIS